MISSNCLKEVVVEVVVLLDVGQVMGGPREVQEDAVWVEEEEVELIVNNLKWEKLK